MSDKVTVVRPDGSTISVSREDAETLGQLGYREQTPEMAHEAATAEATEEYYSSPGQRAGAFLEGAASGLTLGASDVLTEDVFGWDTAERAQYNPGTRIAGEIIGGIAPALATGGESLIAQGLARTPAGLLARGAKALGGGSIARAAAIEGAGLGGGAAVTTATLNGDPLTAEAVIAGAGWGAVFGGGLGFLANKASRIGSKVAVEAGEEAAAHASLIPEEKWNLFRSSVDDTRRVAKETIDTVTARMEGEVASREVSRQNDLARASVFIDDLEQHNASWVGPFSDAPAAKRAAAATQKMRKAVEKGSLEELETLSREFADSAPVDVPSYARPQSEFDAAIAARKSAQSSLLNDATAAGKLDGAARAIRTDALATLNRAASAAAEGKYAQFETLLNEHSAKMQAFAKATGQVAPDLEPFVSQAVKDSAQGLETVKDLKTIRDALDRFPTTIEGFRATSPAKLEKHVAALEKFMAGAGGAELEGVRDSLRKTIGEMSAAVGVTTEGNPARQFAGIWKVSREVAKEAPKAAKTEPLISKGKAQYMAGRLGANVAGQGTIRNMIGYEVGSRMVGAVLGLKSAVLGGVNSAIQKWVPRAANAAIRVGAPQRIDPLRTRLDGTEDRGKVTRRELMSLRAEEIRRAAPTVRDQLYKQLEPIAAQHPEFAASVLETADRQFRTLTAHLPRDPGTMFARMKSMWKPDEIAMEKFARVYEVFQNPVSVARRALETGHITTEAAGALRSFNPEVFTQLRVGMLERLAQPDTLDRLSYAEQVNLGRLLDITVHSTQDPRFISAQQQMFQERNQPLPSRQPAGGNSNNPSGGRPPGVTQAQAVTEH